MRECALPGCERLVRRRGAKFCGRAHRQRAYEIRVRNRRMVDECLAEIRRAGLVMERLRAIVYRASGADPRTGPTS